MLRDGFSASKSIFAEGRVPTPNRNRRPVSGDDGLFAHRRIP